jgi:hypothetical protein
MGGFETYQKMDMIGYSANALWCSIHAANRTPEVFV